MESICEELFARSSFCDQRPPNAMPPLQAPPYTNTEARRHRLACLSRSLIKLYPPPPSSRHGGTCTASGTPPHAAAAPTPSGDGLQRCRWPGVGSKRAKNGKLYDKPPGKVQMQSATKNVQCSTPAPLLQPNSFSHKSGHAGGLALARHPRRPHRMHPYHLSSNPWPRISKSTLWKPMPRPQPRDKPQPTNPSQPTNRPVAIVRHAAINAHAVERRAGHCVTLRALHSRERSGGGLPRGWREFGSN